MTQSDKDFITRIQVSQLVTQDPYADDFYAQVYGAIIRSRLGLQSQDERVLKFGSGGGVGLGLGQKGSNRRPSAMQRMEAQVERIVSNARLREKEKGLHCQFPFPSSRMHTAELFSKRCIVFKVPLARPQGEAIKLRRGNYFKSMQPHLRELLGTLTYPRKTRLGKTALSRRLPNLDGKLWEMLQT
jgi:hypothetical protein